MTGSGDEEKQEPGLQRETTAKWLLLVFVRLKRTQRAA